MENKINIAELLKDCPSGMELDCAMCKNVTLNHISESCLFPIKIDTPIGKMSLSKYGCFFNDNMAKCVIFPKGKTTWEGFVPPCKFKDGDIIFTRADSMRIGLGNTWISIFEENRNGGVATYVDYCNKGEDFYTYLEDKGLLCMKEDIIQQRLATEEEKQKLFDAIKAMGYKWNAETKTLEKLSPNFREHSNNEPLDIPTMTTEFVKEHGLPCPNGYVFKDENGNVINTTKIVLEKIKKEYPKTYKECCNVLSISPYYNLRYFTYEHFINEFATSNKLCSLESELNRLGKLLICRNAYWKIAGKEMGLGKPWEPDWKDFEQLKYCIWVDVGDIILNEGCRCQHILTFPTEEMRDAFYENFKDLIEQCKELL